MLRTLRYGFPEGNFVLARLLWQMTLLIFVLAMAACNDNSDDDTKTQDAGLTTESDTGDIPGTDSNDGSTDSTDANGSDAQGESEIPPVLPSRCTAQIIARKVSGAGSGTLPSLSGLGEDMIAAFSYNSKEANAETKIQLGYYDADNSQWLSVYPFEDAVMSSRASIAGSATSRALVWLESRTEWAEGCTADTKDACLSDVALATLTGGALDQTVPIRVSPAGGAVGHPVATPVADGWVVVYGQSLAGSDAILSVKVSLDGAVSAPQVISGTLLPAREMEISAASLNGAVMVVWRGVAQEIDAVLLDDTGAATGASFVLESESGVFKPRVTAGAAGFMVSFGQETVNDAEIFTRLFTLSGQPASDKNRITFTDTRVMESFVAYSPQMGFAITWLSAKANGNAGCVDPVCKTKVFAALLDDTGALASAPIIVSEGNTDLNPCSAVTLAATPTTWMAAYEILRNLRQQILYSTFTCQ